jgi:hypothetical protein
MPLTIPPKRCILKSRPEVLVNIRKTKGRDFLLPKLIKRLVDPSAVQIQQENEIIYE